MKKIIISLVFSLLSVCVRAELVIEISQGIDNPIPISIVPFQWDGTQALPEDMAQIVSADLQRSGQFRPQPRTDMLSFPHREEDVFYRDWRVLGTEYLVIGNVTQQGERFFLDFQLFDVVGQRKVLQRTVDGTRSQLRDLAHFVSDAVYEHITGIRGAFSTQIVYIQFIRDRNGNKFRLMRSDQDGAREQLLLESRQPIMSPAWSPDGRWLAYVSFETGRPAIWRQEMATAKREQLTNFRGLNGAPAWSPDGQKIAMTLSKDGNPEIYILELATKKLTRVTRKTFAIDTEPNWTADGKGIIFTSNRGGNPQIYQQTLASGRVERLTFDGDYNARGRLSQDGKTLVMVHRENGIFHIAAQDLSTGDIRVLTETRLDESPTIAPNGALLMYATRYRNKGILAAVSLDAGVKFRLPSQLGDVREPAWSPYFN